METETETEKDGSLDGVLAPRHPDAIEIPLRTIAKGKRGSGRIAHPSIWMNLS